MNEDVLWMRAGEMLDALPYGDSVTIEINEFSCVATLVSFTRPDKDAEVEGDTAAKAIIMVIMQAMAQICDHQWIRKRGHLRCTECMVWLDSKKNKYFVNVEE